VDRQAQRAYKPPLIELRKRLIQEVRSTEEALREDIMTPGDHAPSRMHPGDQDAEGMAEQLAIVHNEEHLLEQVETALERIEGGTFGTCENCHQEIGRERLDAIPYAALCIECARREDSDSSG
jgi:RNA polymerase-binding protein DksA